jgi:hypothetical protein
MNDFAKEQGLRVNHVNYQCYHKKYVNWLHDFHKGVYKKMKFLRLPDELIK